jgi:hypothetical protein
MNPHSQVSGTMTVHAETQCLDISEDGALLLMALPLAEGSIHDFSIRLADETLILRGAVRHCAAAESGFQVGVEFVEFTPLMTLSLVETLEASRRKKK